MVIYKTTNLINGKIYIGKDEKNRDHYLGSGKILNIAIKKYGRISFFKEIIEICNDRETLCEREKHWIKTLDSQNPDVGYNIAEGGNGGDTFSGLDDKSKARISNIRSVNAKTQKNFYSVRMRDKLIQSYGSELGELKYKEYKEFASKLNKVRYDCVEAELKELYINEILNLFKDFTIMEIYEKLDKKVPSRLISKFLKDSGVDLSSRKNTNLGINNGMAKLSNDEIRTIRNLKGQLTGKDIAKLFNISAPQACSILRNASYKDI
jgi:hypothetical protein